VPESNNVASVETSLSTGQLLSQTRRTRGLGIEDVAHKLHLTTEHVIALESDNYSNIGGAVFVAGYLRNYAKLLKLDDDAIVAQYRERHSDAALAKSRTIARPELSLQKRHRVQSTWMLLAVVVGVTVGFWLLWGDDEARQAVKPEKIAVETVSGSTVVQSLAPAPLSQAAIESLAEQEVPLSMIDATDSVEDSSQSETSIDNLAVPIIATIDVPDTALTIAPIDVPVTAIPIVAEPVVDVVDESIDQSVDQPILSPNTMTLQFSADCWLEIRDANGSILASRIEKAGNSIDVVGQPPFKLHIGVASAVSINYMNQAVEVVPQNGRKTAKLTVGEAS